MNSMGNHEGPYRHRMNSESHPNVSRSEDRFGGKFARELGRGGLGIRVAMAPAASSSPGCAAGISEYVRHLTSPGPVLDARFALRDRYHVGRGASSGLDLFAIAEPAPSTL